MGDQSIQQVAEQQPFVFGQAAKDCLIALFNQKHEPAPYFAPQRGERQRYTATVFLPVALENQATLDQRLRRATGLPFGEMRESGQFVD